MAELTIRVEVRRPGSLGSPFVWTPRVRWDGRPFDVECVFLDDHVAPRGARLGELDLPFTVFRHPKEEEEPYLTSGISTMRVSSAAIEGDATLELELERVRLPESLLAHPCSRHTPLALAVCDPRRATRDFSQADEARFLDVTFRLHDLERV